jgi:hypothetical protein
MKSSFQKRDLIRSGAIDRVGGGACNAAPRNKSLHYEPLSPFCA